MITLTVATILVLIYLAVSVRTARKHVDTTRKGFDWVIHVNGIRGKSSVTRLIGAAMRENDLKTAAKTTGTSARLILSNDEEHEIPRREANIAEQKSAMEEVSDAGYKNIVFECMAVNPIYQEYLEDKVMLSDISVITNVREDHTDVMGETLPEIAKSLSATIPIGGHVVTADQNPEVLSVLAEQARKRGAHLHVALPHMIEDEYVDEFKHFEFSDNVAVVLKVIDIMGLDRSLARKGMLKALPDPGAFILESIDTNALMRAGEGKYSPMQTGSLAPKQLYWANLFAVNDRESFIHTVNMIDAKLDARDYKKAVILNNRKDRPERVAQFAKIVINDLSIDYVFTFGVFEKEVNRQISASGRTDIKVFHLGNSTKYEDANGRILWRKIVESIDDEKCLIVGAVNIHTPQVEKLLLEAPNVMIGGNQYVTS